MVVETRGTMTFPFVEVRGAPRERGRQHGEACREQVRRYADLGILSRPNPPYRTGDVNRVRLVEGLEQSGISAEDVGRAIASGQRVIPCAPQHEVMRRGHGTYSSIEKVVVPDQQCIISCCLART